MKLKAILAASAFAASLAFLPNGAQARVGQPHNGQEAIQGGDVSPQGDYGQGHRRRGGEGRQRFHNPQQGYQPPQGGYQAPPPPPQAAVQQNHPYAGQRHPRGGHRPPPPVAAPRNADGHYGHRPHDRDRKHRRERFRDGAAVVLGLGVLGALASQPHYDDRYGRYEDNPQPYQPEYEPEYQPGYDPNHAYGQGHPGQGYGYDDQYGGGVFRCSSNDYRTTFCQIPRGARANIRRRLSKASCNYGRDWGIAPNAVWVANGCRAEFHLY